MIHTFAAINVGSFELEMGIYEISAKLGVRRIDHVRHMIALGKDTFDTGKISYPLVEEICQVLEEFGRIMKTYQVTDYRACATTAMREAQNNKIVLDQIRVRTGIQIHVVSNSEQRFTSYKALASRDAEFQKIIQSGTAIVDMGFGSLQISLYDRDALMSTQNLPLGVLRLRQSMALIPTTAQQEQSLIRETIDNELVTYRKIYLKDKDIQNLIGIGTPLLTIYHRMEGITAQKDRVTREEFDRFFKRLSAMNLDQIEDTFDVNAEYASLLFPAAAILERMFELTGAQMLWIPGLRIEDGIAAEYAQEKKLLKFNHDFDNDIIVTSRNMARRYKCHMSHVQTVETEALQVYDSLKKYHGLGDRERLLLRIAAVLHSCGKFVTMRDASDRAYNIIMATEIIGLSHLERELVANVVRYQMLPLKYNEVEIHEDEVGSSRLATPENLTMVIAKLTAMLRLANSMDRGHKGKLLGCRIAVKDKQLVITTDYAGDVMLENISIQQKGDFFEEIFGIRPILKQKKKV